MGIVGIEAQASGLPCIVSDGVPSLMQINDNIIFLPIGDDDVGNWYSNIVSMSEQQYDRIIYSENAMK